MQHLLILPAPTEQRPDGLLPTTRDLFRRGYLRHGNEIATANLDCSTRRVEALRRLEDAEDFSLRPVDADVVELSREILIFLVAARAGHARLPVAQAFPLRRPDEGALLGLAMQHLLDPAAPAEQRPDFIAGLPPHRNGSIDIGHANQIGASDFNHWQCFPSPRR